MTPASGYLQASVAWNEKKQELDKIEEEIKGYEAQLALERSEKAVQKVYCVSGTTLHDYTK